MGSTATESNASRYDNTKLGLVDVGGGLRGAYGAGVLDRCMDDGIDFDCCIGVSAGSANVAAYLSQQRGRNLRFYADYSARSEYLGFAAWRNSGSFLDVEYVYGALSQKGGEDPLDMNAFHASKATFTAVAADVETGKTVYFEKNDMQENDLGPLKASSSVPIACRPFAWREHLFCDGGLSNPIPVQQAFVAGCDHVIVILTRPKDFRRNARKDQATAWLLQRKYPRVAALLRKRAATYNYQLDQAVALEQEGSVLIVAPDDIKDMGTLTRDRDKIVELYQKGYSDGAAVRAYLQTFSSVDRSS